MPKVGLLVLAIMAIGFVAAWINYAVASPRRKQRIDETRATRSRAIMAKVPGTAYHAQNGGAASSTTPSVSEDDAYSPGS